MDLPPDPTNSKLITWLRQNVNSNIVSAVVGGVVGAIVGALIAGWVSYHVSVVVQNIEREQGEKEMVGILAIDILYNLELAYSNLYNFPQKEALKLEVGNWIRCEPHDFLVYENFLTKITLLPLRKTKRIYQFYLELKRIDNLCSLFIILKKGKTDSGQPILYSQLKQGKEYIDYYYDNYFDLMDGGRDLIEYFRKEHYLDTSDLREYFGRIRYFHDLIVKEHPELEKKLPKRP